MTIPPARLRYLIDAVLDGRANEEDLCELESAALQDEAVLREYVDAVNLHTSLQWDYGNARDAAPRQTSRDPMLHHRGDGRLAKRDRVGRVAAAALSGVALTLIVSVMVSARFGTDDKQLAGGGNTLIATDAGPVSPAGGADDIEFTTPPSTPAGSNVGTGQPGGPPLAVVARDRAPLGAAERHLDSSHADSEHLNEPSPNSVAAASPRVAGNGEVGTPAKFGSRAELVAYIDQRLENRWLAEDVAASPRAEPAVWLRRASLDLKGRIPTRDEIDLFLAQPETGRRQAFVAQALRSGEYADHFATVWANLLVGRSDRNAAYRERLHGYLAQSFRENRSWGDVAGELVSAEGTEEYAPTNFLLAHLNNEAVPATAITSRVLLGKQLQCTQCHPHPFNDWKQDEFWQLNAFFQQCGVERTKNASGRTVRALVDRRDGGPTYFEDRRGLMKVAYPIYEGERVDDNADVRRRAELAKLLVAGETNDLARAMVNRVWAHFLGAGFTREVDDLSPHSAVSHPELLDRLAREFVSSGYDIEQLITWVTDSKAYQLSSEWTEQNAFDRPEIGEPALFSRAYEKRLTPEQLYDSLVTAGAGPRQQIAELPSRSEWVAEFYAAQENEENSEMSTFDASPSVALELMNGSLMSQLMSSDDAAALGEVLAMKATEDERLDALSRLALGRDATSDEKRALRRVLRPTIRAYSESLPAAVAMREGYRDVFWAYVNSSEFVVVR